MDNTTKCSTCEKEYEVGDWPYCPHGKPSYKPIGDECDVWVEHGICWDDGSPRHYTSKSEMKRVAAEKGLVNMVRHVDGSPHTKRWI